MSDNPVCQKCGYPKSAHRLERFAHHSECTLEQFAPQPGHEARPLGDFFTASPASPATPGDKDRVKVDPTTGQMHVPGQGTMPLVGADPGQLDQKRREHNQRMALLRRQINSEYRCLQCKRVWKGAQVRAVLRHEHGTQMEVLKCPDTKCDGPVVLHRDALSLTHPPTGALKPK